MPRYRVVPLELREANRFVAFYHRHHKQVQGHRFSIGAVDQHQVLRGCAVVGRPVARMLDCRRLLEVTRLCTDGSPDVCSLLYAACARAGKHLGYQKIHTYILDSETGISLKAAGWYLDAATAGGGQWKHTDGKPRREDQPICPKSRWAKDLSILPSPTWWMPLELELES